MNGFQCSQLDDVLDSGSGAELAAAEQHAEICDRCRAELARWRELQDWARGRAADWDSPQLWPAIEARLRREKVSVFPHWRLWLAAAAMLLLSTPALWLRRTPVVPERDFLTSQALQDLESSRTAYVKSIDQLARLAEPALRAEDSALMSGYREKLLLLDQAIDEARRAAAGNRLNAQVQQQLASLYDEKQRTLREVLEHASTNQRHL